MSDIFAAGRWWLALMVVGTAVAPLTFTIFRRLPDRGYAFTKMMGLLLVSYLFWILGSLGFVGNNLGSILLALTAVAGLSLWLLVRDAATYRRWLRDNWRYVVLVELLFLLLFAVGAWLRMLHPAIEATEKPMEFAFLNAASRTPTFPPIDPWLSGFAISYYYFGYVMMSLLARLAVVPTVLAFNLATAWVVAGTAVGSFGLVYNLIRVRVTAVRRTAVVLGLVAALAIPLVGNLEIGLEMLHANRAFSEEFWQWLDVRDLNKGLPAEGVTPRYESANWWWWRSSRPLNEKTLTGIETGEPIVEVPAFSFILGDIHPHVLALPFALLSLAIALLWWREDNEELTRNNEQGVMSKVSLFIDHSSLFIPPIPKWVLTVLVLGGLSFLNTWDVLIHLFVILGAFLLGQWQRRGWDRQLVRQTIWLALLLVLPAILLYLPFYLGFRSQAGAPYLLPTLVRPTRLPHFLMVFGMPLLSVTLLVVSLAVQRRFQQWKVAVITAVALMGGLLLLAIVLAWVVAASADPGRIADLATELGVMLPTRPSGGVAFGWGLTAVFALLPDFLLSKLQFPGVALLLAALLGLIVMIWANDFDHERERTIDPSPMPFVLLLIATAALLTLGPEFVYLRDNFGYRLNTIFKFYYQAWVMFGIAAIVGLEILWREVRAARPVAWLAAGGYAAAFLVGMLFTLFATQSRSLEFRGPVTAENRLPYTLDGLVRLRTFNPDEYDAIMWLQQNATGLPVVLEATGDAYTSYGRVSANTGLPTVLGWANHEFQWRGSSTPEPGERIPAIEDIYASAFWDNTGALLNTYGVRYIYVGGLEVSKYGAGGVLAGREKFDERLEVAYQNNSVTIYRWQPE